MEKPITAGITANNSPSENTENNNTENTVKTFTSLRNNQSLMNKRPLFLIILAISLATLGMYLFRGNSNSKVVLEAGLSSNPSVNPRSTVAPTPTSGTNIPPSVLPSPKATPKATPISIPSSSPIVIVTGFEVKIVSSTDGSPLKYATFNLEFPSHELQGYQTDVNGYKKLTNLSAGTYKIYAQYGGGTTIQEFTIIQGSITNLTIAVNPTPPDTQPPTIDNVNGPFDWGAQGLCFTINGDQVHDNSSARPFSFSWKLDNGSWTSFTENEVTKCFQNVGSGTHTVSARAKDPAGNEGNPTSTAFTL